MSADRHLKATGVYINRPRAAERTRAEQLASLFDANAAQTVRNLLSQCPVHRPTPLVMLPKVAQTARVARVEIKDERARMGLASFKALGGAYAVLMTAARLEALASRTGIAEMIAEKRAGRMTFAAATAGNHGRAVAAGASLVGARCMIFVYRGVPAAQVAAIAQYGAEIVEVNGVYEDALAECVRRSATEGWIVLSDSSWAGNIEEPVRVMQGYSVLAAEIVEQCASPPTHVFLQAGVGGLAAAVAGHFHAVWGAAAPKVIVVEPQAAPCLRVSVQRRAMTRVPARSRTTMGRLECYEPSLIAWETLLGLASLFIAVDDDQARAAVEALAQLGLATTPSGAAGLAGLVRVCADDGLRNAAHLSADSRLLLIATEAALGGSEPPRVLSR
ncbi:MAG: diaminopropionate ammonia-lyase [Caulobacterales bacterium]|nr:diaminopropionate ammonia-lyase [Caulobacterales bacterium]